MTEFQKFLDAALKNIDVKPVEEESLQMEYDVFEEIRKQIIKSRVDMGISQKELAQMSDLTQANVSKIEKGQSHPTIDTLLKISDGLGKRLIVRFEEPKGEEDYD